MAIPQTTPSDEILMEVDGPIGRITFNRPDRHNAVSRAMWDALPGLIGRLDANPSVRVIVLCGAGRRAFASGADIAEFEDLRSDMSAVAAYNSASHAAFDAIEACSKPTLASIRGYCIGGGLAIASCCDLRYADDTATFAIPAARLGIGYPHESVRRIVDLVGPAAAREMFYTGHRYDAQHAAVLGLVNSVHAVEELDDAVTGLAQSISANAPLTIQAAKIAVAAVLRPDDTQREETARAAVDRCFASDDYREGRRAFLERRPPAFRGT